MQTIWKYPLKLEDETRLQLPECAQVLTIQVQGRALCLWALVDPGHQTKERIFRILGTGHPMPDAAECCYISTVQIEGGQLIFHVFEKTG